MRNGEKKQNKLQQNKSIMTHISKIIQDVTISQIARSILGEIYWQYLSCPKSSYLVSQEVSGEVEYGNLCTANENNLNVFTARIKNSGEKITIDYDLIGTNKMAFFHSVTVLKEDASFEGVLAALCANAHFVFVKAGSENLATMHKKG